MSVSKTDIANMALSHLASGKVISNLETERSREADVLRRFYNTALEACIREKYWPFTRKISTLALVEENPNDEWSYSYRYPVDCVEFRRILSGVRQDNNSTRVPFLIATDEDGLLIYTNEQEAVAEYRQLITMTPFYPSDFVLMFSYKLAHLIASVVCGGDPFNLGTKAFQLYNEERNKAASSSNNEEQNGPEADSELLASRLGG